MKEKREKKKKRNNLNYVYAFSSLREAWHFLLLALLLFVSGVILGLVYQPDFLFSQIQEFISRILEMTEEMNFLQLFLFIFQNNLKTSFLALIGGVALGIIPFLNLLANGYLIGIVSQWSVRVAGPHTLLRLFPHGIFEFPAFIIAAGFGLRIGTFIFAKNKRIALLEQMEKALVLF